MIEERAYKPGDKVPSIRSLARQMKVSINTVCEAYAFLEVRQIIEARPQSGFYVCARLPEVPDEHEFEEKEILPTEVGTSELVEMILTPI